MSSKNILIIGIDPFLIDFSAPEFAAFPDLSSEKVKAGMMASIASLETLGYAPTLCWTDFGETAIAVIEKTLKAHDFDAVVIGAGIRVPEKNLFLFENMINAIHIHAPKARICFNTNPGNTAEAVQRWV